MKETEVSYIAGVVDSVGRFRANVSADQARSVGFKFQPSFEMNRSGTDEVVLGMIDEYCEQQGVRLRINEKGDTTAVKITDPDGLRRFFGPLEPLMIQKHEQLIIFMDELLPAYEDGKHETKEGFIELLEIADEIYELDSRVTNRKYTSGYFKQKWSNEL